MPALDPNDPELYWAAGFLEGEGSFFVSNGRVTVSADQNEREPLDRLQRRIGGRIKGYQPPGNRRYVYRWWIGPWREVKSALELLYPLMSTRRRRQIDTARMGRVIRNGHNMRDKTTCKNGHPFDRVNSSGARICSICTAAYHREWRRKRKAAA